MMTRTQWPFLWTLLLVPGFVLGEIAFLERREGESVVLPCAVEPGAQAPYGAYLRRGWLRPGDVLYMYTATAATVFDDADGHRTAVSGDPADHALNVTVSRLRPSDTDRYRCEFLVNNPSSEDLRVPGKTEFFLLVHAEAPVPAVIELVQTCAGGSAVLPCVPPRGQRSAAEAVTLRRQRAREPVELLYTSSHQQHHGSSSASPGARFPAENVRLSLTPGPGGFAYNVTLRRLQPDDSALYSCQLHAHGGPDGSAGLGGRAFFVSVQGEACGCSGYSTLIYALFSAVAVLLLLLLGLLVVFKRRKTRRGSKPRPPAPIYEEMTGVQPLRGKHAPNRLDETDTSEYRNCSLKKPCPENYYERPSGALSPRTEAQK